MPTRTFFLLGGSALMVLGLPLRPDLQGQEAISTPPKTRLEQIENSQQQKASTLRPEEPPRAERFFDRYITPDLFNTIMGGIPGLRLRFGGQMTGSGFSLGPEYLRPDLVRSKMVLRFAALGSTRQYYLLDSEVAFPRLAHGVLRLDFLGRRSDSPSVPYYGPGPDSRKGGRTNFRQESNSFDLRLGIRPRRRYLRLGVNAGYLWINVGPGQDSRYASAERVYPPSGTPGLIEQSHFFRGGPFVQFDYRDKPRDPHRGGNYLAQYTFYEDRVLHKYSFRRLEGRIEQYMPLANEKRVLAFRAKTQISYQNSGQVVPFYLQPTLGGSDDLRGFRSFRFYDNNLLVFNAEYRWEVFRMLDMALFADGGKVFHRAGDFDLKNLESSLGFGARFKAQAAVVFRIDVGFSHEGYQIWFKFEHVF